MLFGFYSIWFENIRRSVFLYTKTCLDRQRGRWTRPIWKSNQVTIFESGTNDPLFAHLVNHLITAGY